MKLTKSETEVLNAIDGVKRLPKRTAAGYGNYKRHDKAIQSLKDKGLIKKAVNNILSRV